jgi:hypothetical protein
MSCHRTLLCTLLCTLLWPLVVLALAAGCDGPPAAPDASPPSTIPTSTAGSFAITSRFDVEVPAAAAPVLGALAAATDGPDDPARFLVDRMIATLPDGPVKLLASQAAPYLAAYLQQRLVEIAPRLVDGLGAISDRLSRIAGQLGTIETLQVAADGAAIRTITGARFEIGATATVVGLAEAGLADIASTVQLALDPTGQIAISRHAHRLPYGALLRLGLDRAVVPSVEPTARDLAGALGLLVDCERLAALIAGHLGFGSPALYLTACRAGMTAIAAEIDDCIAAIDHVELGLDVTGAAAGVDLDGDGTMDELRDGTWAGAVTSAAMRYPFDAASFTGRERPRSACCE